MASRRGPGPIRKGSQQFTTTEWTLVLAAGDSQDSSSREALATLCQTYWYPVYVYIRRCGYERDDAEDLAQGFFTQLLEGNSLKAPTPERGRFRSFLLASVRHFLANERDREQAKKRGGGKSIISLDFDRAEMRPLEPAYPMTPETIFERRWVLTVGELDFWFNTRT